MEKRFDKNQYIFDERWSAGVSEICSTDGKTWWKMQEIIMKSWKIYAWVFFCLHNHINLYTARFSKQYLSDSIYCQCIGDIGCFWQFWMACALVKGTLVGTLVDVHNIWREPTNIWDGGRQKNFCMFWADTKVEVWFQHLELVASLVRSVGSMVSLLTRWYWVQIPVGLALHLISPHPRVCK